MHREFSIYLDALRASSAILVFLSHMSLFMGGLLWQFSFYGHEAVLFFFVLSGYVISYVANEKDKDAVDFFGKRFARIYSVAIPAIVLTLVFYYLGNEVNPERHENLNTILKDPFTTTFSALLFVNQSWWSVTFFTNMPYWSLGYEVLYYCFFGVSFYLNGTKKIALLLLLAILMGPSVILYLPIWYAGVLCHHLNKKYQPTLKLSIFLFSSSSLLIIFLCLEFVNKYINDAALTLVGSKFYELLNSPSKQFAIDYILTIAIVGNIFSAFTLTKHYTLFTDRLKKLIASISSMTFSLYLYHMPILFLVSSLFPYKHYPFLNIFLCTVGTLFLINLLSKYTEKNKAPYLRVFHHIFSNRK